MKHSRFPLALLLAVTLTAVGVPFISSAAAGSQGQSTALERGYAVASTDGGHGTGQTDVLFGLDPQARSDYGYNAVGQVTDDR